MKNSSSSSSLLCWQGTDHITDVHAARLPFCLRVQGGGKRANIGKWDPTGIEPGIFRLPACDSTHRPQHEELEEKCSTLQQKFRDTIEKLNLNLGEIVVHERAEMADKREEEHMLRQAE